MKKIDHSTATVDNEFTEGNPSTGTPATRVEAEWLNVLQAEIAKLVEMAGIALDQTGVDREQAAKALAVHVAGLDYYDETGAADAYVLTVIGADEAENTEPTYFDGMRVRFLPGANNTGAATVRVGAQAIKNIKEGAGAGTNPAADRIVAGVMTELYYDETNDVFKFSVPSAASDNFSSKLFHAQHQEPNGTDAPNAVSGRQTRPLNTVLTNEIAGASLSSNVITLPAGTYFIDAYGTIAQVGDGQNIHNKLYLRNSTDSIDILEGRNEALNGSNATALMQATQVTGRFTLAAEKDLILSHEFDSPEPQGLGYNTQIGTEVYADVRIWKVA